MMRRELLLLVVEPLSLLRMLEVGSQRSHLPHSPPLSRSPSLVKEHVADAGMLVVEYEPGRRPARCMPGGLRTRSVRVSKQRVLVGMVGSWRLAMVSENQDSVA